MRFAAFWLVVILMSGVGPAPNIREALVRAPGTAPASANASGPYLGRELSGMTPALFAPGIVSTPGRYLFFSRRVSNPPDAGWGGVRSGNVYWVDVRVVEKLREER